MPAAALFFVFVSLLLWGISGVTQKLSTNRISSELSFLWFTCAMVLISAALILFEPMHWHVSRLTFWLAVSGGTLNGLGALTSFLALESGGKASIVISLISLFPLPTVAFAIVVLHEHLTVAQAIGIALAIAAAILLSQEKTETLPEQVPDR
ncbi:MAG: EamA family transporter [Edaphobacter sp.]|uniref:EamA family transporter n=1 Tax=Edaphobacter sp. TaxID=1934404 RepID=UPI0023A14E94|nr:EamA family transporter [Edaphobacter sp.]MDE1175591.1 EamA family transporter [Edaphobacter sp.]